MCRVPGQGERSGVGERLSSLTLYRGYMSR